MKIKAIHIENVRGLGNCDITLNMIPNKPSVLVAPNGSGKSSFALAFKWLNKLRMKLDEDNAYMGNTANKPSMTIETTDPDKTLLADGDKNEIVREFGIHVINGSLKATMPGLTAGFAMGKAHISVPEVVLFDRIPENKQVVDDFETVYAPEGLPVGYFPVINAQLKDNGFMSSLDTKSLRCQKRKMEQITSFIERSKDYEGTVGARHDRIQLNDYATIADIPAVAYSMQELKKKVPTDSNVRLMLKAVRLVTLYYRKKEDFEARKACAQYNEHEQSCKELFSTLKQTWKNIAPHRDGNTFTLKIPDTQRISNGERDIIVFLANLYSAKSKFTKTNNILIIDEVFDYLDEANMMAAQFYITRFIKSLHKEGKNIFPVILSHLNPDYYSQHYSFKDLKVYYLKPLPHPHASDNMVKLLRSRKVLAQAAGQGAEDDISKYMLHFHSDYTKYMDTIIGICPEQWANIKAFKHYCMNQLDNYLENGVYDALAVCVALRELIEERVYSDLSTDDQKNEFLCKHGTSAKLDYAEAQGVDVPELYYLLGNIYNDPMHVDNKSNKLITQTLYSRMENNTVRSMILAVKENRL